LGRFSQSAIAKFALKSPLYSSLGLLSFSDCATKSLHPKPRNLVGSHVNQATSHACLAVVSSQSIQLEALPLERIRAACFWFWLIDGSAPPFRRREAARLGRYLPIPKPRAACRAWTCFFCWKKRTDSSHILKPQTSAWIEMIFSSLSKSNRRAVPCDGMINAWLANGHRSKTGTLRANLYLPMNALPFSRANNWRSGSFTRRSTQRRVQGGRRAPPRLVTNNPVSFATDRSVAAAADRRLCFTTDQFSASPARSSMPQACPDPARDQPRDSLLVRFSTAC